MAGAAPRFEKRRYVPPGVRAGRLALISVAIGFLALLLLAPLGAVLGQAFAEGWRVFLESFDNPDTLAAIKLTLLTAAIVVPVNTLFGIAAAWAIAKFEFKGKDYLLNWVLPNFYFHVTTAYNILRHNGVEIGKKDFLGG